MKPIHEIRVDLGKTPDVFYDHEPEETERGTEGAVQTLWNREEEAEASAMPDPINLIENNLESEQADGAELDEIFEIGAEIDEDRLQEALGGGLGESVRKSIELRGVDALGWYVTFHARGVQWGIYIKSSSVMTLAAMMFNHLAADLETRLRIAFRAIHQHEIFHFATDYMSAQWELIAGQPCHQPARALRDKIAGYNLLEEALANANMIRSSQRGRSVLRVRGRAAGLRDFTTFQPPGYRDAYRYVSRTAFMEGCEELARNYLRCIADYGRSDIPSLDLMGLYPQWPHLDWRCCPVHVINDTPHFQLPPFKIDLFRTVEGIEESREFLASLARAPARVQDAWMKAKQQLAISTAIRGLDFKAWQRRRDAVVYSVRLGRNNRAHLERRVGTGGWVAVGLGTHTDMGHD
jgi:hypothetical protein